MSDSILSTFLICKGTGHPVIASYNWVKMKGKVKRKNVLLFIPAMPDSVAVDTVNRDGASPSLSPSVTAVENISMCRLDYFQV